MFPRNICLISGSRLNIIFRLADRRTTPEQIERNGLAPGYIFHQLFRFNSKIFSYLKIARFQFKETILYLRQRFHVKSKSKGSFSKGNQRYLRGYQLSLILSCFIALSPPAAIWRHSFVSKKHCFGNLRRHIASRMSSVYNDCHIKFQFYYPL